MRNNSRRTWLRKGHKRRNIRPNVGARRQGQEGLINVAGTAWTEYTLMCIEIVRNAHSLSQLPARESSAGSALAHLEFGGRHNYSDSVVDARFGAGRFL